MVRSKEVTIDYKEKIRKLLALAESPIEAEARAALLKARRLMAEHKLTERECKEGRKQIVRHITDITCSKRREPWIIPLSAVIGENYCCQALRNRRHGKQTNTVGFIGLEDDIEICVVIFKYAVDCIRAGIKNIKQEYNAYYLASELTKQKCDSYGYGFVNGISQAFKQQYEENQKEWGLVLTMPLEIKEAVEHHQRREFISRAEKNISYDTYQQGYTDGKDFNPTYRLKSEV